MLYRTHKCAICHGDDGGSPGRDGYPVIAGQNQTYLSNQMLDIRDGVRDNGRSRLMRPLVKGLGRAEIEAIAAFLSGRSAPHRAATGDNSSLAAGE